MPNPQKKLGKGIIIFSFAALILIIIILLSVDNKKENLTTPTISNENILNKTGTIDGYDPASGTTIDPVRLWSDYKNRTFAGTVRHGEKVKLIKRDGDGVLIEKRNGKRGWVTYFFIKGLK